MAKNDKKNWFAQHKVLTVILVIVGLIIIGGVAGGGSKTEDNSSSSNNTSSGDSKEATAKVGQAVRDGKFEFKVTKIKCGETKIGDQYLNEKAQGQFCRLSLSIENIGNEAQSLLSSDQKLIDNKGREFQADDTATLYAASGNAGSMWFDEINPGNSVKGDIIFDVSKGAKITTVELHDSSFSNGVKVSL